MKNFQMNKMEKEIISYASYREYIGKKKDEDKNNTKEDEDWMKRYEKYKELIDEEDWAID